MAKYGSYQLLHDKLVRRYRRNSLYLVWMGVLALFCLIIFIPTFLANEKSNFGIGGTFNMMTSLSLITAAKLKFPKWAFVLTLVLSNFAMTTGLALLGYKAYKGNLICLIVGTAIYGLDSVFLSLCPFQVYFIYTTTDFLLSIAAHVFMLGLLGLAFYNRHQIVTLAQKQRNELEIDAKPDQKTTVLSYKKPKRKLENKEVFGDDTPSENNEC